MEEIEKMEKDGTFDLLPKKEVIGLKKEYEKLNTILCGIRDMHKLPDALFIVDPSKEDIAIREARKLHIPVFGIVDTNCDPDMVDYVIPGNDDAIRAVKLITGVMANAIVEANGGKIVEYVKEDDKQKGEEIMQKAVDSVKRKEDRQYRSNDRRDNRNNKFQKREERFEKKEKVEKTEKVEKAEKKVEPKKEVKKETTDLSKLTVSELRDMAKEKDIKGYSTMKKAELIDALK